MWLVSVHSARRDQHPSSTGGPEQVLSDGLFGLRFKRLTYGTLRHETVPMCHRYVHFTSFLKLNKGGRQGNFILASEAICSARLFSDLLLVAFVRSFSGKDANICVHDIHTYTYMYKYI